MDVEGAYSPPSGTSRADAVCRILYNPTCPTPGNMRSVPYGSATGSAGLDVVRSSSDSLLSYHAQAGVIPTRSMFLSFICLCLFYRFIYLLASICQLLLLALLDHKRVYYFPNGCHIGSSVFSFFLSPIFLLVCFFVIVQST